MWFKVFADGNEIDIIHAKDSAEAIQIAQTRHGNADVWHTKPY